MTIDEAATEAVRSAFGDMAFIDAHPSDPAFMTSFAQVLSLRFTDPGRGMIALLLPYDCKRATVENVYGVEWDSLTANRIDDCLLELLNVIGGAFMRSYYGSVSSFAISLPELVFDESQLGARGKQRDLFFDAEGVVFQVRVWIEGV